MGIRRELTLRLPNSPGALTSVCRVLADERVVIDAMTLDVGGHLHLIVDNHLRASAALRDHRHTVVERDVLLVAVEHTPGAIAPVVAQLSSQGINIDYAYGGSGSGAGGAVLVLGVEDALRASTVSGI